MIKLRGNTIIHNTLPLPHVSREFKVPTGCQTEVNKCANWTNKPGTGEARGLRATSEWCHWQQVVGLLPPTRLRLEVVAWRVQSYVPK